ncbi:hypothetical protein EVG20_g3565 [Dentipellis fragilis]|uniref:F-box domain-containing protein n=1 Tax=Dentipellis fragilis TaxID=205917 RepID=A0A4Y9Z1J4_9AGAM|nr:hypothetical protein EVG20_g3565 [Dentipellis fragilis]
MSVMVQVVLVTRSKRVGLDALFARICTVTRTSRRTRTAPNTKRPLDPINQSDVLQLSPPMAGGKEVWRGHFQRGIEAYRGGKSAEALQSFSSAIDSSDSPPYTLFDSRAAVYEQAGRYKDALLDSKKVIDLAADRWQGYARAARLFLLLKKYQSAAQMTSLALERIPDGEQNNARRESLVQLENNIRQAQAQAAILMQQRQADNRVLVDPVGNLPVELISHIFLLANDSPVTPLYLSHVSRRWHDIAISLPSLWRVLVLSKNKPAEKAKIWKSRARHWINELRFKNEPGNPLVIDRGSISIEPLQKLISDELDDLQWERVKVCKLHDIPLSAFERALAACHLRGCLRDLDELQVIFHDLVSVDIRNSGIHRSPLRALMQANPKLEKLVFHASPFSRVYLSDFDSTDPLTMAHLEHLEFSHVAEVSAITNKLSLPALQVLRLWSISDARPSFDAIVQNMGSNVEGLTELSFRQSVVDVRTLARVLLQSLQLEIFQLCSASLSGRTNDIVDILNAPPSASYRRYNALDLLSSPASGFPIACPSLRHVDLSQCSDLTAGPVVRMVSVRLKLHSSEPEAEAEPSSQPAQSPGPADGVDDQAALPSKPPQISKIETLVIDGCQQIEADTLPWLRQSVPMFSCVYLTKKEASRRR